MEKINTKNWKKILTELPDVYEYSDGKFDYVTRNETIETICEVYQELIGLDMKIVIDQDNVEWIKTKVINDSDKKYQEIQRKLNNIISMKKITIDSPNTYAKIMKQYKNEIKPSIVN